MSEIKAKKYYKDIEDARCKGQFQLLSELGRKYKKHEPRGEGN